MIEEEFQKEVPKKISIKLFLSPILGFVFIILIALLVIFIFNRPQVVNNNPNPTTVSEEQFTPKPAEIKTVSPLATDAAVLKVKKEIEENTNQANTIDLSESNLSFPIIDFNIGF